MSAESNPKYRRINFRVSEYEYAAIISAKEVLGMSAREVIEILMQPCAPCSAPEILIQKKKNTKAQLSIKRNLLCKNQLRLQKKYHIV